MELAEINNMKMNPRVALEKGVVSFQVMTPESKNYLDEAGIKLTKATDFYVGTHEPEVLEQRIKVAKEKGFFDAYVESPRRMLLDADLTSTRIAELEALGITYKSPEGKYISALFGRKAEYNKLVSAVHEKARVETPNIAHKGEVVQNEDLFKVKETAEHVLEQFAMLNLKNVVFNAIDEINDNDLGAKEKIMEAFKKSGVVVGNIDLLSSTIDEILSAEEQNVLGRAA